MTVRLIKLTASDLSFPGMEPYNTFSGAISATLDVPVLTAQKAIGYISAYQNKSLLSIDTTVLEPWEAAILGLSASGSMLAQPDMDSVFTVLQPPSPIAGQISEELWYALGAGPGDPAVKVTYARTDPLFPLIVTGIKTEHTLVP